MNKKFNNKNNKKNFWEKSDFLFSLMGIFTIVITIITYFLGMKYIEEPAISALIVVILNFILIIFSFLIMKGIEKVIEISKIKSSFINTVSHQLRGPVVNLEWIIDAIEEEKDKENRDKYIISLKENIDRIKELIEYFFISSKIQEGEVNSKYEKVDIGEITKKVLSRFKIFIEKRKIEVNLEVEDNIPSLFTDKSQIKLVIENLLDNAIYYNKENGKIDIHITNKNNKIYFEIKDSGIGILEADKKYIFQKFFRAKNAEGIKEKGSGLGLSIAKFIIEDNGGKIWFNSNGSGTTFFFYLPVKKK